MNNPFAGSKLVDLYFQKECPYTKRRPLNMTTLLSTCFGLFILFVVVSIWFGGSPEKNADQSGKNASAVQTLPGSNQPGSVTIPQANAHRGGNSPFSSDSMMGLAGHSSAGASGTSSVRAHAANQVIRRGENGNDPLTRLPLGTTLTVKLVNSLLSTNAATPVIAEIPEDVLAHNTPSIPAGTKAIGQATFDDSTQRIQIQFNTFVYPEGDQHAVQGMAMESDGSAGLSGDYHSQGGKRELGNFLGNFIGGFANGMEDRTATGFGTPYEIGSLRDGALNGVSLSAQGEAKAISDDLAKTKPYMTLAGGKSFLIFLAREYLP